MAEERDLTAEQKVANIAAHDAATTPYYLALGKFIHQYSLMETVMFFVLSQISGVNPDIAKAIYSGTRVNQARDFINRILDVVRRDDLKERLKPFFHQIGLITSVRDDLLHYGAGYKHAIDAIIFTNARSAHIANRYRSYKVNSQMLEDLSSDTTTAYCGFIYELLKETPDPQTRQAVEELRKQMFLPWRYKPPPLIPPEKENLASDQ